MATPTLPTTRGNVITSGPLRIEDITNEEWNTLAAEHDVAYAATNGVNSSVAELNLLDASVQDVYATAGVSGIAIPRVALAKYDVTGGDTGTVGAQSTGVTIPANSIILGGMIDVTEVFTDGADDSATMAISVEGANDIVTAIAISDVSNPWDVGLHAVIPLWTAATAVKTTTAKPITVTVADDTIASGSMTIALFYIPTEVNAA